MMEEFAGMHFPEEPLMAIHKLSNQAQKPHGRTLVSPEI